MSVDKNLFMYNLSVAAIMKNEGPYIKEWLDYNLLAGVEHFYIYDNDSPDNMKEVLQPYIEKNIVTYTFYPGKCRQYEAYMDAVNKFKFESRYIAFIDGDEFIFPQNNKSIGEVLDEVFEKFPKAGGLAVNWYQFGTNFLETADYSRGVLERFTMRSADESVPLSDSGGYPVANAHIKTIANPRKIDYFCSPHFARYFVDCKAVNENGDKVEFSYNNPPTVDKIVINHYGQKSREEYQNKVKRGVADLKENIYERNEFFHRYNDVFDDSILEYVKTRRESILGDKDILDVLPFENEDVRVQRVMSTLLNNFSSENIKKITSNISAIDVETILTWRMVSEKFNINFGGQYLEEFILKLLIAKFSDYDTMNIYDGQQFIKELPKILSRPFATVNDVKILAIQILPMLENTFKILMDWDNFDEYDYTLRLLKTL